VGALPPATCRLPPDCYLVSSFNTLLLHLGATAQRYYLKLRAEDVSRHASDVHQAMITAAAAAPATVVASTTLTAAAPPATVVASSTLTAPITLTAAAQQPSSDAALPAGRLLLATAAAQQPPPSSDAALAAAVVNPPVTAAAPPNTVARTLQVRCVWVGCEDGRSGGLLLTLPTPCMT